MALSNSTKIVGAVVLGTGITLSGIAWMGGDYIEGIKKNIDNMKNELTQAIEDNEFLKGQFNALKGAYDGAVSKANATIETLNAERIDLLNRISELRDEIANIGAEEDQERKKLIEELSRLESELAIANAEIEELAAYTQAADEETTYTALDRKEYEFNEQAIQDVQEVPIDELANAVDPAGAKIFGSRPYVEGIEQDFAALGFDVEIVRVSARLDRYGKPECLAYIIEGISTSEELSGVDLDYVRNMPTANKLAKAIGSTVMYLNTDGKQVGSTRK